MIRGKQACGTATTVAAIRASSVPVGSPAPLGPWVVSGKAPLRAARAATGHTFPGHVREAGGPGESRSWLARPLVADESSVYPDQHGVNP